MNYTPLESINMAAFICFSCTIFIPVSAPGYTDSITYYFLFLSFIKVRKPYLSATLFGFALLNHESALFILPALILYSNYKNNKNLICFSRATLFYAVALLPYLAYRYYVSIHSAVEYNLSFYFSKETIRNGITLLLPVFLPGLFFAFKLFWVFPVFTIIKGLISKAYALVSIILVIIICCICQLILAYDTTRLLCLIFPAILLSAEYLRETIGTKRFEVLSFILIILNFFVYQYIATSDRLVRAIPIFWN
jgi:hypothetical protein